MKKCNGIPKVEGGFSQQTEGESQRVFARIDAASPWILFVALGCAKQESWIYEHRGQVHAVMLGEGAAFDTHARSLRQAPSWMQKLGLECFLGF